GEVRKLLAEKDATVRFRAALALLAGRDKAGVPPLIELATEAHADLTWQAEDVLVRLADGYPAGLVLGDTDDARALRRVTWTEWWEANAAKTDLAKLTEQERHLGYTLVQEMHAIKMWDYTAAQQTPWSANYPAR